MSRHTKEDKRARRRRELEAGVKGEETVFDVFRLLAEENTETKPNMAKFLKGYVKSVSGHQWSKPVFWPPSGPDIAKYFVRFLDGHELMADMSRREPAYYFYMGVEEVETSERERALAAEFFRRLFLFKFAPPPRGRSITDRTRGSEPRDAGPTPAGPATGEAAV